MGTSRTWGGVSVVSLGLDPVIARPRISTDCPPPAKKSKNRSFFFRVSRKNMLRSTQRVVFWSPGLVLSVTGHEVFLVILVTMNGRRGMPSRGHGTRYDWHEGGGHRKITFSQRSQKYHFLHGKTHAHWSGICECHS